MQKMVIVWHKKDKLSGTDAFVPNNWSGVVVMKTICNVVTVNIMLHCEVLYCIVIRHYNAL